MSLNVKKLAARLFRRFTPTKSPTRRVRLNVTALEDRTVPTAVVSITTTSDAPEGSTAGLFELTRTGDTSDPLTVGYTVGGTATPGTDYTALSGTATFAANASTVFVEVWAASDGVADPGETVSITLSSGTGYTIGAGSETIHILDNSPTVTVAAMTDAPEGGMWGGFVLTHTGDTNSSLTVDFTVSGTATAGTDYTALGGSATFAANADTAYVYVEATDDSESEPTETVVLTLSAGTGYVLGSATAATVNIYDNDAQVVTVATVADATEGSTSGTFRFTRTGDLSSSLTANYTVGGTATSGTDYTALSGTVTFAANSATADVTVAALADNVVDDGETVVATVTSGTGYSVGTANTATVTIADDAPVIAVTASDTFEGSATGGFSFTRTGGDIGSALTVTYTVSGTATSGTDYTALSGSVTFATGVDRVEVFVEALGDNVADDGETVIATLTGAGTGYTLDPEADEATVTIADQPLTVSVLRLSDGEEGVSNGTFRFTRSGDISSSLTVTYTVGGTATAGSDYTALSGSVTFAVNSTQTDVTVTVTDDGSVEPTETVTVTLDEDGDYALGNASDALFIRDNDTRRVYWVSTGSTDWSVGSNWSINAVPVATDDVYFSASYSNVGVSNLGYGGTGLAFAGIHFVGDYSGTVALAVPLTVGTYEQTTGTLTQDISTFDSMVLDDLTVTAAFLWSGGSLNTIDSGASVILDGAVGFIDPGNGNTLATASGLNLADSTESVLTFRSGELNFTSDLGIVIGSLNLFKILAPDNATIKVNGTGSSADSGTILVKTDGTCEIASKNPADGGTAEAKTLRNDGGVVKITDNVTAKFTGSSFVAAVTTTASVHQTSGKMVLEHGSTLEVASGLALYGGSFSTAAIKTELKQPLATIKGDMSSLTVGTGALATTGAIITICDPAFGPAHEFGRLVVQGNVLWTGGSYRPKVDALAGMMPSTKCDLWYCSGTFTVSGATATNTSGAKIDISYENVPLAGGIGAIPNNRVWEVLGSGTKIVRQENASYPLLVSDNTTLDIPNTNPVKKLSVRKT